MKTRLQYLMIAAILAVSLTVKAKDSITVFAAASTTNAMKEIATAFTNETGVKVKLNLASSGSLARQMEYGAPADYYISASKRWAKYATSKGLLNKSSLSFFMKNSLVVIAPINSKLKPFKLSSETNMPSLFKGRLSMGDPMHVPAGKYAKAALTYYKWYKPLKSRLQPAKDVRAALMVVEFGETDLGIVYSTDARKSSKVKVVSTFPDKSHPPIVYVSALCKNAPAEAKKFDAFLLSPKGAAILKKHGFQPIIQANLREVKLTMSCIR